MRGIACARRSKAAHFHRQTDAYGFLAGSPPHRATTALPPAPYPESAPTADGCTAWDKAKASRGQSVGGQNCLKFCMQSFLANGEAEALAIQILYRRS